MNPVVSTVARRLARGCALLLPLALLACAGGPVVLRTELTSYNEWPAGTARAYVFVAPVGLRADAPERALQQALEAEVAAELDKLAWRRVAPSGATLAVTVRARLVPQVRYVAEPIYYDPFWRGRWDAFWSPPGWYGGFAGYRDYPVTVYQREVSLTIDDLAAGGAAAGPARPPPKRVYEGTVRSVGLSNDLAAIAPYLVRALFMDFPGMNGQTRTIDVPVDPAPAGAGPAGR